MVPRTVGELLCIALYWTQTMAAHLLTACRDAASVSTPLGSSMRRKASRSDCSRVAKRGSLAAAAVDAYPLAELLTEALLVAAKVLRSS